MIHLSIIIPAYNEEERITETINSFVAFLSKKTIHYELIVVDDGSSDKTIEIVENLSSTIPNLRVIALPENKGKGAAVREGMLAAEGEIRLFSDADGATPIEELDKVIQPIIEKQSDISIGSRYHENSDVQKKQPLYRVVWSRLANKIIQRILLPGIVDPHCGFKAFTSDSANRIFGLSKIDEWSFDLEVLALARRMNFRIAEIPVKWIHDERSKGRLSQLPKEIKNVWRIRRGLAER